MFQSIEPAPADPILGLNEAFQNDPSPNKINLGVGVYKDEAGTTPVLACVKEAERRLLEGETSKSYLGIAGLADYAALIQPLMLGADSAVVSEARAATVQTPGGTGALRVAGDFVHRMFPKATIWVSSPTWANHPKIFEASGLKVCQYGYLNESARGIDFDRMLDDLNKIPAGDVIVLHGCCHNPSGIDPSADQWQTIAETVKQREMVPLLDFAYQGFGSGLEEDALGLRTVVDHVDELLVASSFSKNFGLYRERIGALTAIAGSSEAASTVLSQLKTCVRTNYSNPPAHGGAIVETILKDAELREQWTSELAAMRDRINAMRTDFVAAMKKHAPNHDFSFLLEQQGMFSFSGLSPEQVDALREQHSIYIVGSGRINVAGITPSNVDRLAAAIATVL